jgi:ParB family chromosome partitioning protein
MLATTAIVPDEGNRKVAEDDDFLALCDSIRLSGVLQPIQVWRSPEGSHRLVDGERRWRAAQKLGLKEVPCDVWPAEADPRRLAVVGLVLNEHRKAHGCLHVARRLRDIKNESGLTHEGTAEHTGLALDRVKTYFALFAGSDELITFLEQNEIPLRVAVELVRYERATNEGRARRLAERHKKSPLTVQEIVALRKRDNRREAAQEQETPARPSRPLPLVEKLEAEVRRDRANLAQLEELARRLGYRLVPIAAQAQA